MLIMLSEFLEPVKHNSAKSTISRCVNFLMLPIIIFIDHSDHSVNLDGAVRNPRVYGRDVGESDSVNHVPWISIRLPTVYGPRLLFTILVHTNDGL